jgi:hypothetical protein
VNHLIGPKQKEGPKVEVLLECIATDKWLESDKNGNRDVQMTRDLLFEFIGGEPELPFRRTEPVVEAQ